MKVLALKRVLAAGGLLAAFAWVHAGAAAPKPSPSKPAPARSIDFSRDIRPILSDNCFACHGPDDKARKAGLRFDLHDEALKPAKSGDHAIVPGDVKKSTLVERIFTADADEVMPPPKSARKLTAAQRDLLKRWIAEGASWKTHWAYEAPKRSAPPDVKNKGWGRNEIDRFILARLEKENLQPNSEADKVALIRRVTLDLTGLPPTPAEVDAFLADKAPDAYETLVDRLLKSPRYGEHLARYWLDAARYADSHGYHIDSERSMWKWRDWVVESFNQNMPFDQFTLEQLAGDLLPDATLDQKIGSGYVRANMSTGEGGAIVEEYQSKYTFDRLETTSTIWMGLTLTCARCHTHKYDPITQKEYYGLYAFFNSLNEEVMDGNKPNPNPFLKVPTTEQARRQEELKTLIADGQKKLDAPLPELDGNQPAWESSWHRKLSEGWTVIAPGGVKSLAALKAAEKAPEDKKPEAGGNTTAETPGKPEPATTEAAVKDSEIATAQPVELPQFKILDDQSVLVSGVNPASDAHEVVLRLPPGPLAALRLEALPHDSLPNKSSARADDGKFRLGEIEAELVPAGTNDKPKKLKFTRAFADSAEGERDAAKAIDGKPDTGWQAADTTQPRVALFLCDTVTVKSNAELRVTLRYGASQSKRAIGRFRLAAAQNDDLVDYLVPPKIDPWQKLGPLPKEGELSAALDRDYGPEAEFLGKGVDLKRAYPGVREEAKWGAKDDWKDGQANTLVQYLHGVNGTYYLTRIINAPSARPFALNLKADEVFKLWVNGKLVHERREPTQEFVRLDLDLRKGENRVLLKVVNHDGESNFTWAPDLKDADSIPSEIAALFVTGTRFTGDAAAKVKTYYRRAHSAEYDQQFTQTARWREENTALEKAIPLTMVAGEMDKMRETFLLMRGEYDKKGDMVSRGTPAILPPFPKDAPTNRLGLARWLIDPSHPLTARVTVNRFWQQYFGVGLVKTTEDFGVQSEPPSHPELLDWLATEFVRTGWDMKQLQKLLVTSAAYRQSSKATPALLARDPENRLLARSPRFRVDGEVLRDSALFIGGLLAEKRGGRAVKPYEPPGLWEAVSFNNSQKYVPDTGEGRHRRSLYTYWKRQSPPPNMLLFDAPTREYCVVRRPRTNTPLQALALLNDPQFVESSRGFAQRMLAEGGRTTEARIAYGFRLATARKPGAADVKVLADALKAQLADYAKDPESAVKLLESAGLKRQAGHDTAELAAWTLIASMILNLDETVTKG